MSATSYVSIFSAKFLSQSSSCPSPGCKDNGNRLHDDACSVSEASHLQVDPEWTAEKELCMRKGVPYTAPVQRVEDDEHMAEEASGIAEGGRCEVHPGGKRGVVRWGMHFSSKHRAEIRPSAFLLLTLPCSQPALSSFAAPMRV